MTERHIETDIRDGVATLTLGRAPVNALSSAFLDEFGDAIDTLSADDAVQAIILRSPFKVFSAGLDLKEAQGFSLAEQQAAVDGFNGAYAARDSFWKRLR